MENIKKHQVDYKPKAYEAYTIQELGNFVHLLAKRATHRANAEKKAKDLYDAGNYLAMIDKKLSEI